MEWVRNLSLFLEPIYYLSILVTVGIGLRQMFLLKKDILTKNDRASKEKAVEYLDWFASEFLPSLYKYKLKYEEVRDTFISRVPKAQQQDVIEELNKGIDFKVDANDSFLRSEDEIKEYELKLLCMSYANAIDILNRLELFASVMTSGLADEKMAYAPLSHTYCSTINEFYLVICKTRNVNNNYYSNVTGLYKKWKARMDKEYYESKAKEYSEKLSQLPDSKTRKIGL